MAYDPAMNGGELVLFGGTRRQLPERHLGLERFHLAQVGNAGTELHHNVH